MRNFSYSRPSRLEDALALYAGGAMVLAGGTTAVDLMKLGVMQPQAVVDITQVKELQGFDTASQPLRFGALARMADVAEDTRLKAEFPALAESLALAASQQLRNAARLGGNLLQRTRCQYYRDVTLPCNRREPGSGCGALQGGVTSLHAVLGGSDRCVALYPGDWAVALIAFEAEVETISPRGARRLPLRDLYRLPNDRPELEHNLQPGEIIVAVHVPQTELGRASTYVKVRDRESYAFASASAAVGLALDGEVVRDVRIGLGGVATVPWRAREAEQALIGKRLTLETARLAGRIAFEGAKPLPDNAYKIPLGIETVAGALMQARARA